MDWHKLQHTLFEMDPSDPREDLKKLQAQANGGGADVPPTKDYVAESVDVPQGSMPLGLDSISDFAALAGVRLDEKQKMGSAGQAKGKDPMPTMSKPSRTGEQPHPLKDKLVGEDDTSEGVIDAFKAGKANYNKLGAVKAGIQAMQPKQQQQAQGQAPQGRVKGGVTGQQLAKQLGVGNPQLFLQAVQQSKQGKSLSRPQQAAFADAFQRIMAMDPKSTTNVMMLLKRMEAESIEEESMPKPRDPNAQTMQNLRKSGAMGAHKDKKKVLPRKEKHKGKAQTESIKDMLYRKLAEKK